MTEPLSGSAWPRAFSGLLAVGEGGAVGDGQHRLGVLAAAEPLPYLGALLHAVLLLRGEEGEGGLDLTAAAVAEETADHGGQRDQVGQLERLDLADVGDRADLSGEHVLAGEGAALLRLDTVGVEPVDVRLGVGHRLPAALAAVVADVGDLRLQVLLGVRGLRPELLFQALVGLGAAREGGQLAAADVPEEVDEPEPVLPGRVPGAELRAVAGGALDVRHPGLLVAGDRHVLAGTGDGGDLVLGDAEGGVLEELGELVVGERAVAGGERVVRRELVVGVLGLGAERPVGQDLDEGGAAVVARRQDVQAVVSAVIGDRRRVVGGGRWERGEQPRGEGEHSGGRDGHHPAGQ